MPIGLPPPALAGAIAFLLLLLAGTVAWFAWLLRRPRRERLAILPALPLAACAGLVAAPWIATTVHDFNLRISIDGAWELALFVLALVAVYLLWIVAPLTYIAVAVVWLRARRRRRFADPSRGVDADVPPGPTPS